MSAKPHCQQCGGPAGYDPMVKMDEDEFVHSGPCHYRAVLHDESADMQKRLFAALDLWDSRQHPLIAVKVGKTSLLGVLVNHRHVPDRWVIEDSVGEEHEFERIDSLEVVDDAFDVAA